MYNNSQNRLKALKMLHDNINKDVINKNLEISQLQNEKFTTRDEFILQKELKYYYEKHDTQSKTASSENDPSNLTLNEMKFELQNTKAKIHDYTDDYKGIMKIYHKEKPLNFIVNVNCILTEMMHQFSYKLWRLREIMNLKYPNDIKNIIEMFKVHWKEENMIYFNRADDRKSNISKESQALVDFLLGKLK